MKNLLLLLILANILYLMWGMFGRDEAEPGVSVVDETELGPALVVASRREENSVASVGAVLGSGEPSDLAAVVGRSCVSVGPFRDTADADEAITQYQSEGMRVALRSAQGQVFVGHSVQVQSVGSRQAGNDIIRKLNEGGLGDAFIVGNEADGYAISLGIFGNEENAEKVELQAESIGFEVDISPMMRTAQVYFVDIGLPPGKGAGAIVEKHGEEKVRLRDAATCPASE